MSLDNISSKIQRYLAGHPQDPAPSTTDQTGDKRVDELQEKIKVLEQSNAELQAKVNWYEEQLRLNAQRRFGSSSEKVFPEQVSLFNEAEETADPKIEEPSIETITYKRRKRTPGDVADKLEDLPVETVVHDIPESDRICPKCGEPLHEMSIQIRRELKVIPAQVVVVEHQQPIYTCRNCERHADDEQASVPVIKAEMPKPCLPKTIASASLVAFIIDQKYTYGLPLYRLEQQFRRFDVDLSRQTLSNWLIAAATKWCKPLYDRMHTLLLNRSVIHADETPLQVLREKDRPAQAQSRMWLYRSGARDGPPIILYEYTQDRSGRNPKRFLKDFHGYLQVDAYSGYNQVDDVVLVLCFAHARRQFTDALKALPAPLRNKDVAAKKGLQYCDALYHVEHQLSGCTDEERYEKRLELSRPILDEFHAWLLQIKPDVLPRSQFGQGVQYCLNNWEGLTHYLLDGRLEIDNNSAERAIKPFVMGRKAWLFSNTPKGAESSAILYSIVETAKGNRLKPYPYLVWLFEQMPNANITDVNVLDSFLPFSESIPQDCRMPSSKK